MSRESIDWTDILGRLVFGFIAGVVITAFIGWLVFEVAPHINANGWTIAIGGFVCAIGLALHNGYGWRWQK